MGGQFARHVLNINRAMRQAANHNTRRSFQEEGIVSEYTKKINAAAPR